MSTSNVLKNALDRLEDSLSSPVLRQNSYQDLQNALSTGGPIDGDVVKRLLVVCILDLNENLKYTTNALTIINAILLKIKKGQCSQTPELVSSALSIISLLKVIAPAKSFDALKGLLFNTLLSYPDNTLMCVVADNTDKVLDFLDAYINVRNKVAPIKFITTMLNILPPANKKTFVEKGLKLWFARVIPIVMSSILQSVLVESCVELLELLAEVLVDIDYGENPHWKTLIVCIYTPSQYPAVIKTVLENQSDYWHRVWIVFIKLLKNQITKVSNSNGSPINSLLPVVESAFKMDPLNRCRAFQCWSVLIDNFSMESNEAYVNKRLKLLIIPLKSSNAKVAETAKAKFDTWWHLIRQFHSKMEGLTEMVLMPFIHFCFGKAAAKSTVPPGQISETLKELSLQALVEIFGHVDCTGCAAIPGLKSRLITTKILVDHWNDWICCLKAAITTAVGSNSIQMKQQITCIWKSFVMTVGELPENNIRKDLFNELLALISLYIEGCQQNTKLADIVMDILIKSLFTDDDRINSLLVTKETGPMYTILPMLSNSFVEEYYKSKTSDELLQYFKPVTNFMMNDVLCCPNRISTWLLDHLPANDNSFVLWTALAEAVCESNHDLAVATLTCLLSYPIQNLSKYNNEKSTAAAYTWFTTYSLMRPKLEAANFDDECIKTISEQFRDVSSALLTLHVSLAVVKNKLIRKIDSECEYVAQIFLNSLSSIDTYSSIAKVFPALIDTLVLMTSKLTDNINVAFAKVLVMAFKVAVKLLIKETINETTIIFVDKMMSSLLEIIKVTEYQALILIINEELLACSSITKKHASKIKTSLSVLTSHLLDKKSNSSADIDTQKDESAVLCEKVGNNTENLLTEAENTNDVKEAAKSFNTPEAKTLSKKSNKRAASIVNTVVENGEEYVVVKSNWKFNPRKLTENQKEKLKRIREDIPALYQDLSQSQDEFKLRTWKTDSQDTTTSSKSASKSNNEDASTILNQIPNTDVVPRIFENILADSTKTNVDDKNPADKNIVVVNNNTSNVQKQTTSTKDAKSPRLALKDRVFRNVRNLIEKSGLQKDETLPAEDMNKTMNENIAKTPINQAKLANVVNSAPPKIVSERPSRVIKKPKKFDDSELLSLKKRRRSVCNDSQAYNSSQSQSESVDGEILKMKKRQQSVCNDSQAYNSSQSQSESVDGEILKMKKRRRSVCNDSQAYNSSQSQSESVGGEILKMKKRRRSVCNDSQAYNSSQSQSESVDGEILKTKKRQQSVSLESQPESTDALIPPDNAAKVVLIDSNKSSSVQKLYKKDDRAKNNDDLPKNDRQDTLNQEIIDSQPEDQSVNRAPVSENCEGKHSNEINTSNDTALYKIDSTEDKLPCNKKKESRIAKQLEINMVEGHPLFSTDSPSKEQSTNHLGISDEKKGKDVIDVRTTTKETLTPPVTNEKETGEKISTNKKKESRIVKQLVIDMVEGHPLFATPTQPKEHPTNCVPAGDENRTKDEYDDRTTEPPTLATSKDKGEKVTYTKKKRSRVSKQLLIDAVEGDKDDYHDQTTTKETPFPVTKKDKKTDEKIPSTKKKGPRIVKQLLIDTVEGHPLLSTDSQLEDQLTNCADDSEGNKATDDNWTTTKETPILATNENDSNDRLPSPKKKGARIVKQLLIDTVEGHPLLQAQPEGEGAVTKRAKRKSLIQLYRESLSEKHEKIKSDLQITPLPQNATKTTKKLKENNSLSPKKPVITLSESQGKQTGEKTSFSSDDQPMSEDVIESSQDSSITTISVKSSKSVLKKQPVVILKKANVLKASLKSKASHTQDEIFDDESVLTVSIYQENKEDSQFPKNVTVEKPEFDLTENMDTQPVEDRSSSDVIFVENVEEPIVVYTENMHDGLSTQETAEADTEPMDVTNKIEQIEEGSKGNIENDVLIISSANTQDDTARTISETSESVDPVESTYSPSKDEPERQKDFLNNTQEISPIKTLSPLREKQSPSPETNREYVVIKLTSPVHSNGEPYEKCDSPEIFTEDKISPEKRNESPPRVEVIVNNTSPSSSLSLKKNRPQRRVGGRAAQMLDLCASMNNDDSGDSTDIRKSTPVNTPAKRNLKSLYNSSVGDGNENADPDSESTESDNFLKFKRSLPTADSSPAGPILKRKFTDITDEATTSPANKRKRVSFHDPPVSTTVAVQKYIEPGAIRSPQHSTIKRRDRPTRNYANMKSPKKLESVFKLDTVLSKAVESFSEEAVVAIIEDTQISSMEQTPTPALEVVKASDLNDTDPICPALLGCNDPIEIIAAELSSPAMKSLFVKEIEGKVRTISDLAKMTELEVNRLCIKAPKVKVARKVLLDYAFKRVKTHDSNLSNQENEVAVLKTKQTEITRADAEIQTSEVKISECGFQTDETPVTFVQTQTECTAVSHRSAQTDESGYKSTEDVIASSLSERPDFIAQLSKQLDVSSVTKIANKALPFNDLLELLSKKMTIPNSVDVTNKVLEVQSKSNLSCDSTQNQLSFVQNYLCHHFDTKDLILFCSQLLQKVYDKPT